MNAERPPLATFDALADVVGDGIAVSDVSGKLVYFNKAAERILGRGLWEVSAEQWSDYYGVFLPDGVTAFPVDQYPLMRALRGEETDGVEQLVRNRSVPEGVLIAVTGRPIRGRGDEITGAVVSFRDITELKRAQLDLARAVQALRTLERQKAELAKLLVHDLQSPLSVILGNADFMLNLAQSDTNADCLRDIRYAAENMRSMVMDLLDISLSETGALAPKYDTVDVDALLAELGSALRYRADYKQQKIELGRQCALRMRVDREFLRRILQNLIENSIKYAPQRTTITLEAAADDSHVLFQVRDEGPGVPAEYRERIFELYAQTERSPELHDPGSRGLGLRFCRIAVDALEGSIWADGDAPSGSRFCVKLPRRC